jgi:acyl-CoA reductase-like NAD-dependent aldehyde dehydrogenase
MPDADDAVVDEALEACRTRLDKWRQLSVLDRLQFIAEAGKRLAEEASFDALIPGPAGFPGRPP